MWEGRSTDRMTTEAQRSDVATLLRTEHAVARVLGCSAGEEDARPELLEAIGRALGWHVGAYWEPEVGERTLLRCVRTWHDPAVDAEAFVRASLDVTYDPDDVLPGRVWRSGEPAWVADVRNRQDLPRAGAAARSGLRTAFGVPITGATDVLAAMEFFTTELHAPDDELLATMTSLGSQIGQFVERCRAQQAVTVSDARKSAILNAAFDCIITMDGDGRIVEVNEATVRTFGYTADEMVGAELAALMIPDHTREQHRRGLERYMRTGASRIVGHPVNLVAMRADGSEFPVELAVTRPELPGPALFCGYLRDVTEQLAAERALQHLADEQAALRRVATAVAAEVEQEQLFALVTEEVGRLLEANRANVFRYEDDHSVTAVGTWSADAAVFVTAGTRIPLDGPIATELVQRTGRPARVDDFSRVGGATGAQMRELGLKCSVAAPVSFGGRLWGALSASSVLPGPFPEGAEHRLASFADLAAQALANAEAREQLAASRARIVEAGDAERRRLERNLHDGAQQRLVATSLSVRLAARRAHDPDVRAMLERAGDELNLALEELRELARGLHPATLTDHGLPAAIEALAARAPVPVRIDIALEDRLPEPIEAAAYYVVAETLTNVAKYASASEARVLLARRDGHAHVEVSDDGVGGADARAGSGLRGLADRVEALGGRLTVTSPPGEGTQVRAELPVRPARGSARRP
jgi:PAS domain S-box-containing protein